MQPSRSLYHRMQTFPNRLTTGLPGSWTQEDRKQANAEFPTNGGPVGRDSCVTGCGTVCLTAV